jgi:iron(III) transport system permease protein
MVLVRGSERPPVQRSGRDPVARRSGFTIASWVVGLLFTAVILYPVVGTLLRFVSGDVRTAEGASPLAVLVQDETLVALSNTLVLIVLGGLVALVTGVALAWLNERTNARIGMLASVLPLISMFTPSLASAIGWVFLFDPEIGYVNTFLRTALGWVGLEVPAGALFDLFTWPGLIWAYSVYLMPFVFLAVSNGLRSIDPALEEASGIAGASTLRTLVRVTLPSLRPSITSGGVVMLVMGFALFSVPMVIGPRAGIDVLPVLIVQDLTQTYPPQQVEALMRSLIIVAFVLIANYVQKRAVTSGPVRFATLTGKMSRASRITFSAPVRLLGQAWAIGYLLIASVLPVLALLLVSLQPFWSATIATEQLSLLHYERLFSRSVASDALVNSITLGIVCALVLALVSVGISYIVDVRRNRFSRLLDTVLKLPVSVTHVVIAVALLLAFGGAPFHWTGTLMILLVAYLIMYLPQALLYSSSSMQVVGRPLIEASMMSGASDWRTARKVLLPLMTSGLIAGAALVFVLVSGDITASVVLSSTRTPVVGYLMLDQWSRAAYGEVAALGVVMTAISTVLVVVVLVVRDRSKRLSF